ncbi:hypothetical protein [Ketobacter sp.]|uniref:hypothetical protein n=1 Tax=Ketobacter sp. TaxID=2083498 RepID=UPI000F188FF9|nr:hypothetical protein [Ketobacter sp.]RLU01279.1 MAG: hypothetical protein D9N14_02785 [Ketobacter sp.]
MKQIVLDWLAYCRGDRKVDQCVLARVFSEELSCEELEAVFSVFNNGDSLLRRYLFIEESGYDMAGAPASLSQLRDVVLADVKEKMALVEDANLQKILQFDVGFVSSEEELHKHRDASNNDVWFREEIHDTALARCNEDRYSRCLLMQAYYDKFFDYDLVLCLIEPAILPQINLMNYMDVLAVRGKYCIGSDQIFIYSPTNQGF